MCPFKAAKGKLEAARAEAAQLTGRLGEAEAEAKKHALLLQHIHVSAATDPSRLLTKCAFMDAHIAVTKQTPGCTRNLLRRLALCSVVLPSHCAAMVRTHRLQQTRRMQTMTAQ